MIFTITNSGAANLTLALPITITGTDASLFTVTAQPTTPVLPNGTTSFTVRFAPLTSGAKSAAIQFGNNDGDENPFDIVLVGTGSAVAVPEIGVEQPVGTNLADSGSRNFGAVTLGGNADVIFTITNSGTANLTLALPITITGTDASLFTVTAPPTTPVLPGGTTSFTVRFAPLTSGAKSAAIQFGNNDGDENPFDIVLTGIGAAVAIPEIGVEQPVGVNIVDGGIKGFGSVLAGNSTSFIFTITNSGAANLSLTQPLTVTGADASLYTVTTQPTSPVFPGGTTSFTVRFAPLDGGVKTAVLQIVSDDSNEGIFDIILTGSGLAPEIAVAQPVGTNLPDGGSRNFGSVLVGTTTSLAFNISNIGTADLTLGAITIDGVDAALFTVTTSPTTPVVPGGSTTLTVQFRPLVPGTGMKTAALHFTNNDRDENSFDLNLTGLGTGLIAVSASPITLNLQTAHFEQSVRVTNSSSSSMSAVRLLIQGLPLDVQVRNATGTNNSNVPYVQHNFPLAGSGTVDFLIEYYRSSRVPFVSPVFALEVVPATPGNATGSLFAINAQRAPMQAGRYLIEFPSLPGRAYAVQYSSDLKVWKTASPFIYSPDNQVQWYDDGPPKTESKPSSVGSRFYRAVLLP